MEKYKYFEQYLQDIYSDVYPQPEDPKHSEWASESIDWLVQSMDFTTVLDVGCGEAFTQPYFQKYGKEYTGITLGEEDYNRAIQLNRNVIYGDFNFIPFDNETFDVVYSRHSLEHSPMPIISLMEWHRVSKNGLCIILPRPGYWGFVGRNHYSVMVLAQIHFLLERAGWKIIKTNHTPIYEFRFICEKMKQ